MDILPHVDCNINQGGIHTIHECLYHRVPMLTISGERHDQNGAAARVDYHGLGLTARQDASAKELGGKLDTVLGDRTIQQNVDRMQQSIERYRADQVLERCIARLL